MKLYTMEGASQEFDISRLSDFEAGVHYFKTLDKIKPNITWGEVVDPQLMGGLWSSLKKATTSIRKGVGSVLSDTLSFTGKKIGESVRLITDKKVMDGISRGGMAYATAGGSEGARGFLSSLTGSSSSGSKLTSAIGSIGAMWKKFGGGGGGSAPVPVDYATFKPVGMDSKKTIMIAGGAVAVSLLIMMMQKKR